MKQPGFLHAVPYFPHRPAFPWVLPYHRSNRVMGLGIAVFVFLITHWPSQMTTTAAAERISTLQVNLEFPARFDKTVVGRGWVQNVYRDSLDLVRADERAGEIRWLESTIGMEVHMLYARGVPHDSELGESARDGTPTDPSQRPSFFRTAMPKHAPLKWSYELRPEPVTLAPYVWESHRACLWLGGLVLLPAPETSTLFLGVAPQRLRLGFWSPAEGFAMRHPAGNQHVFEFEDLGRLLDEFVLVGDWRCQSSEQGATLCFDSVWEQKAPEMRRILVAFLKSLPQNQNVRLLAISQAEPKAGKPLGRVWRAASSMLVRWPADSLPCADDLSMALRRTRARVFHAQ